MQMFQEPIDEVDLEFETTVHTVAKVGLASFRQTEVSYWLSGTPLSKSLSSVPLKRFTVAGIEFDICNNSTYYYEYFRQISLPFIEACVPPISHTLVQRIICRIHAGHSSQFQIAGLKAVNDLCGLDHANVWSYTLISWAKSSPRIV